VRVGSPDEDGVDRTFRTLKAMYADSLRPFVLLDERSRQKRDTEAGSYTTNDPFEGSVLEHPIRHDAT
jgi:hypothetical protein